MPAGAPVLSEPPSTGVDTVAAECAAPLLFLHIPKTAGSSLRRFLLDQYAPAKVLPAENWREVVAKRLDPRAYRLAAGHFRANFRPMMRDGARVLTVLREPVARLLSDLRHARRDPAFDSMHDRLRRMPLAEIIRHPEWSRPRGCLQTAWLAACADASLVSAYLAVTPDGDPAAVEPAASPDTLLRRAMATLEATDFVGFAEDLPAVIDVLCGALDFHPPARMPLDNVAAAPDETLTPADFAAMRRLTEPDRELYDFAWRLRQRRRRRGAVFDVGAPWADSARGRANELLLERDQRRRFTRGDIGSRGMVRGWSRPEAGHTWNDGPDVEYALATPAPARDMLLEIAGRPYVRAGRPSQRIVMHANGLRVFTRCLTADEDTVLTVPLPAPWWACDGSVAHLRLAIHLPDAIRPCDIGDGDDARRLGFSFHALLLRSADASAERGAA